jgi:hypothetical protein
MAEQNFDVFLCHNSEDKLAVIEIAEQLRFRGIKPWLDIWELQPGAIWQSELEQQIESIGAVAVFAGQRGIGPWQSEEIYAILQEFTRRKCPVIPVLLPDVQEQPHMPIFLRNRHWVDFRLQEPNPLSQLLWGISGKKIERELLTDGNSPSDCSTDRLSGSVEDILLSRYVKLDQYLYDKDWKGANKETYTLMISELKKRYGEWFTQEDIVSFPIEPLKIIDELWVKHSESKYGFSIQRQLYVSCGGVLDGKYYGKLWDKFSETVEWQMNGEWSFVNFEDSSAHGHLPVLSAVFDTLQVGNTSIEATTVWSGICPALLSHPAFEL